MDHQEHYITQKEKEIEHIKIRRKYRETHAGYTRHTRNASLHQMRRWKWQNAAVLKYFKKCHHTSCIEGNRPWNSNHTTKSRSLQETYQQTGKRHAFSTPACQKGQKYLYHQIIDIFPWLVYVEKYLNTYSYYSHIVKHENENSILYPLQHGSEPRRSCDT